MQSVHCWPDHQCSGAGLATGAAEVHQVLLRRQRRLLWAQVLACLQLDAQVGPLNPPALAAGLCKHEELPSAPTAGLSCLADQDQTAAGRLADGSGPPQAAAYRGSHAYHRCASWQQLACTACAGWSGAQGLLPWLHLVRRRGAGAARAPHWPRLWWTPVQHARPAGPVRLQRALALARPARRWLRWSPWSGSCTWTTWQVRHVGH